MRYFSPGVLLVGMLALAPAAASADEDTPAPAATPAETPTETPTPDAPATTPTDPGDETDVIVVTGARSERSQRDAVVPVTVVSREEIERSGANNLADLLQDVPGVELFEDFRGPAVRMMGLQPAYVLVLVDGERTVGRVNGAQNLLAFALDDVERVEIVRGASSALWGSEALAGVINIITRRGQQRFEASARSQLGSLNGVNLSARAGVREKTYDLTATTGFRRRDPYDLTPSDLSTTGSGFTAGDGALRGRLRLSGAADVGASVAYSLHDQAGVDIGNGGAVFDVQTRTERFNASVRPEFRFDDGISRVHGSVFFQRYRDQFFNDQRGADLLDDFQVAEHNLLQLQGQFDTTVFGRHLATVGIEASGERLRSERVVNADDRGRGAAYGQVEATFFERLVLAGGVRTDFDTQFGVQPTPKLAARYQPIDPVTLRVQYGWGYRAPDFSELYLLFRNTAAGYRIIGNTELEPETSQSISASGAWRIVRGVEADVQVFRNDVRNQILPIPAGQDQGILIFQYDNIASAWTQGVETALRVSAWEHVRVSASHAFLETRDEETGLPLPGRPRHRATLSVQGDIPQTRTRLAVRGELTSLRDFYFDVDGDGLVDRLRADPATNLDAQVAQSLGDKFEVFAGVTNILNAGDAQLHPVPPRAYYGGIEVRY